MCASFKLLMNILFINKNFLINTTAGLPEAKCFTSCI